MAHKSSRLLSRLRRVYSTTSRPARHGWNTNYDYFHWTRGRFLINEEYELSMRTCDFDMNELVKCAAEAVGSTAADCFSVLKIRDGNFSKTFRLSMSDGTEVLAKMANLKAGPAHYMTASEVATIDFARNVLNTPMPEVLAWSSRAENNPVRAEYILMKRPEGRPLPLVWGKIDVDARCALMRTISQYQKAWMSESFDGYGSLYYMSDLQNEDFIEDRRTSQITGQPFVIGPSTGQQFFDQRRIDVEVDRGPYRTLHDYKSKTILRENTCVQSISPLPQSQLGIYGPGTYQPTRMKKIVALQNHLRLLPYLLPTDESITTPFLWHPGLDPANIWVDSVNPSNVTAILGWQSAEILPLYDHSGLPNFINYVGLPVGLQVPQLPRNLRQLPLYIQAKLKDQFMKISVASFYKQHTNETNKLLSDATAFRETPTFAIMDRAQRLLVDGEALSQLDCLNMRWDWHDLPGVQAAGNPPFPLAFTPTEIDEINADATGANKGIKLMQELRSTMLHSWRKAGFIPYDEYQWTKQRLYLAVRDMHLRRRFPQPGHPGWKHVWPFTDSVFTKSGYPWDGPAPQTGHQKMFG